MSTLPPAGRFAPSPTGDLHLGNLRTALLAWLHARSSGRRFLLRMEDLDRVRAGSADRQLADLEALGLTWDGPVTFQSERRDLYDAALARLIEAGWTYECFCTRREIAEAASAPQHTEHAGPPHAYPGTCRTLTRAQRRARRRQGRPPAIRLRAGTTSYPVVDLYHGEILGVVDDVVLRRNDGVPAYNLAVVVDDAAQGIDQVVRGDDLLASAPRQAYLAELLGLPAPTYAHVPLVLGPGGQRLAKRDGAVTLSRLAAHGWSPAQVTGLLAASLGLPSGAAATGTRTNPNVSNTPITPEQLLDHFDPAAIPTGPWVLDPATLTDPTAPRPPSTTGADLV